MKAFTSCEHIKMTDEKQLELGKELYRPEHDGRFFIVTELCGACMAQVVADSAAEGPIEIRDAREL